MKTLDEIITATRLHLEAIERWARGRDDVRAVYVFGSYAGSGEGADEWSDVDLLVVTGGPEVLPLDSPWAEDLGSVWSWVHERTPLPEVNLCRVIFEDALDMDFLIVPRPTIDGFLRDGLPTYAQGILDERFRALVDKDALGPELLKARILPPLIKRPTPADLRRTIGTFFHGSVIIAKKVRRGDLWWAHSQLDLMMRWSLLLRMIQWHTMILRPERWGDGAKYNRGKYIHDWADPRVIEALPGVFAPLEARAMASALLSMWRLFVALARETAEAMECPYPEASEAQVGAWLVKVLDPLLRP